MKTRRHSSTAGSRGATGTAGASGAPGVKGRPGWCVPAFKEPKVNWLLITLLGILPLLALLAGTFL